MDITYKTRSLYNDELLLLKRIKTENENRPVKRIKVRHLIIAGLVGGGSAYLASIFPDGFWMLLFGVTAVISFGYIVFMPYEFYKIRRNESEMLRNINAIIESGTVDVCFVNSGRIALAEEYEDEVDLYIVELSPDNVLYLWDYYYNLETEFPCRQFEIYRGDFSAIFEKEIYPLSDHFEPTIIDKEAKWKYMNNEAVPGHLQIDNISFDELIDKIKAFSK